MAWIKTAIDALTVQLGTKAEKLGDSANQFSMAAGTTANHGINKTQLEAYAPTNATNATNATGSAVVTGAISSSSPSAGIGYATGSGGSVTQLTSITTAVTLNKINGIINCFNDSLSAGASYQFTVNNSSVDANDLVLCCSGNFRAVSNAYGAAAGMFRINIYMNAAWSSGSIPINFIVLKGVIA